MGFVFGLIVVLVVLFSVYKKIGITGLILATIFGGVGFALGSAAGEGWGIYGAILGALIGLASKLEGKANNN